MMKYTTIRLNAFHKDSSASYSKTIRVSYVADFLNNLSEFENEVPFSRWFDDHEYVDGDETLIDKIKMVSDCEID